MSMDDLECPVSRLPLLAAILALWGAGVLGILGFWDLAQRRALLSIIALMMGGAAGGWAGNQSEGINWALSKA